VFKKTGLSISYGFVKKHYYIRELVFQYNSVDRTWLCFFDIGCVKKIELLSFGYCWQWWRYAPKLQLIPHVYDVIMLSWILFLIWHRVWRCCTRSMYQRTCYEKYFMLPILSQTVFKHNICRWNFTGALKSMNEITLNTHSYYATVIETEVATIGLLSFWISIFVCFNKMLFLTLCW